MKVQSVYDQGSGKLNEDELLIKSNLYAVFDGMSSLVNFENKERKTGGKIAAETAKEIFSKNNKPLNELALNANKEIAEHMKREGIDTEQKEALWSTHVAAVRLENENAEYFSIGDCSILGIYDNGSYKLIIPYTDIDLETMRMWKKLANERAENIWEKLKHQTDKVRREVNIKYGCLNGEKEAVRFFNYGSLPLQKIKSLILFTDGLLIPKENPEDPKTGIVL